MSHFNYERTLWVCISLVLSGLLLTEMGCGQESSMSTRQEKSRSSYEQLAASAPISPPNAPSRLQGGSRANDAALPKLQKSSTFESDAPTQVSKPRDPLSSTKEPSVDSSTPPLGMKQELPEPRPVMPDQAVIDAIGKAISQINARLDKLEEHCQRLQAANETQDEVNDELHQRLTNLENKAKDSESSRQSPGY